jgi:hypothetical protein
MNSRMDGLLSTNVFDDSFHMKILKESLVKTIHDIDFTFSNVSVLLFLKIFRAFFIYLVCYPKFTNIPAFA